MSDRTLNTVVTVRLREEKEASGLIVVTTPTAAARMRGGRVPFQLSRQESLPRSPLQGDERICGEGDMTPFRLSALFRRIVMISTKDLLSLEPSPLLSSYSKCSRGVFENCAAT